jgi:hypothetical protein
VSARLHPYGKHSRSVLGTVVDEVRRSLLLVLPEQPPLPESVTRVSPKVVRRLEWHAVATALGDLLEDVVAFLAVAFTVAIGVLTVAILLWFAPSWFRAVFVVVLIGAVVAVWWLRVASDRLDDIASEIKSYEDGAR